MSDSAEMLEFDLSHFADMQEMHVENEMSVMKEESTLIPISIELNIDDNMMLCSEKEASDGSIIELDVLEEEMLEPNSADTKLFQALFAVVSESELAQTLHIAAEICRTIAEYSNGYFIYCSYETCLQKEFSVLQSELNSITMFGKNEDTFVCNECRKDNPYISECCYEPAAGCPGNYCNNELCTSSECAQQYKKCKTCKKVYCNQDSFDEYGNFRGLCGDITEYQCWVCGDIVKEECDDCSGHCYDYCKTRHCSKCRGQEWKIECVTCGLYAEFEHAKCGKSLLDLIWDGNPGWGTPAFKKCGCFQCKKYICLECNCEILIKNQKGVKIDDSYYCLEHKNWINE
eukprot:4794_1